MTHSEGSVNIVISGGMARSKFVVVHTVQGELVAHAVKAHLESEGIPVLLQYESLGVVYAVVADGLGEVRILVPKEFVEEAKRIIKTNE